MKKKLLSLVLAGAMVASTSVSAFADTDTVNTDGGKTNVTIKGSVANNQGEAPAGTISVSIPTSLSFKVDKDGTVSGGEISIKNNGLDTISITAVEFQDKTPTTKITVKTPDQFNAESSSRSDVVLSVGGNQERVYLKSEEVNSGKNGICDLQGSNLDGGKVISRINGEGSDKLTLLGVAGKTNLSEGEADKGVTDEFILTLKVNKVRD